MKKLLLAGVMGVATFAAPEIMPAMAGTVIGSQCGGAADCTYDPVNDITYFDPAVLHVTATGATGQGPVLLNNNTTFSIQDVSGQNVDQPLTVYIGTLVGQPAPTITSASYTNPADVTQAILGSITQPSPINGVNLPATITVGNGAGQDIYSLLGCMGCDASLNLTNLQAGEAADGHAGVTQLKVYGFQIPQDMVGGDEINVVGSFADGSIVFPFGEAVDPKNPNKVTIFDTSWTNTGFVDCAGPPCTMNPPPPPPPPPPPVPEPGSLALLGAGLGFLGFLRLRRR